WKSSSSEVRNIYSFLAQLAKKIHEETYPDYVYQPKKRSERMNSISNPSSSFTVFSDVSDNDSHSIDNSSLPDISLPSLPDLTPPADNYNNNIYNNNPWSYTTANTVSSTISSPSTALTDESFTLSETSDTRYLLPQLEHCRPIYMTDPYDRKMIDQLPL